MEEKEFVNKWKLKLRKLEYRELEIDVNTLVKAEVKMGHAQGMIDGMIACEENKLNRPDEHFEKYWNEKNNITITGYAYQIEKVLKVSRIERPEESHFSTADPLWWKEYLAHFKEWEESLMDVGNSSKPFANSVWKFAGTWRWQEDGHGRVIKEIEDGSLIQFTIKDKIATINNVLL